MELMILLLAAALVTQTVQLTDCRLGRTPPPTTAGHLLVIGQDSHTPPILVTESSSELPLFSTMASTGMDETSNVH
jgi:hypothetical protein